MKTKAARGGVKSGPTRELIQTFSDRGWRNPDGSHVSDDGDWDKAEQTLWGRAGHIKWAGPRSIILNDGTRAPSIPWGEVPKDPTRIMYLMDKGDKYALKGLSLVRTCDFHTFDGGDHYCMNLLHWAVVPIEPGKDQFFSLVDMHPSSCWLWMGPRIKVAGKLVCVYRYGGREVRAVLQAHNYTYPDNPIPKSHTLRNHCGEERCVLPDHYTPVRVGGAVPGAGRKSKDYCKHGHPMDKSTMGSYYLDTNGHKHCRVCNNERQKAYRHRTDLARITEEDNLKKAFLLARARSHAAVGATSEEDPEYWTRLLS